MSRSRVLMVIEHNGYPFDRRVRCQAESLGAVGYEVAVLCPREPGEPAVEVIDGVSVYRFPPPPPGHGVLGYMWEYAYATVMMIVYGVALMVRPGFDVLHAHNPPDTVFLLGAVARLFGKRFVFDHRDPAPDLYVSKFARRADAPYHVLLWLERACCRLADLVVTVNESCRRLETARHGVPERKIVIAGNGPRLSDVHSVAADPDLRRCAATIIGYVGSIGPQDGLDYLLRSLHYLKYSLNRSDFYAVLIGPAEDLDPLQRLVEGLDIGDHVRFVGKLPYGDDLFRYVCTADICVEPAPSSPLNDIASFAKVMEYMAFARPIVAFDVGETRLTAAGAALYATSNDEAEFARQIARLMDSPDLRIEMGRIGRHRIEETYSWEKASERLIDGYERLIRPRVGKGRATPVMGG